MGHIELIIGHSFDDAFVILPVATQLHCIHCCPSALQPHQEAFIFRLNAFKLFAPHEIIEGFVGLSVQALSLCDRIIALLCHNSLDLVQQQFILPLYLDIPDFSDHFPFAIVDGEGVRVLHEASGDRFDLTHVQIVVNVGQLELFLLYETVQVGTVAIHTLIKLLSSY